LRLSSGGSALETELALVSAYRDSSGRICADAYEPTRTVVPTRYAAKVADARQVRR
jgi:hypothetical protein